MSESAAAENEELADDSMEKLAFDDEDEHMVSGEDLLGGKSLMMSDDSENEEVSTEKLRKISPKARRQRVMDSDLEEDAVEKHTSPKSKEQKLLVSDEEDEQMVSRPKKKASAIIYSDNDEEPDVDDKKEPEKPSKKNQNKKVLSDQEDQDFKSIAKTETKKKVPKKKKQLQEDNLDEDQENPSKKEKAKKAVRSKKQAAKQAESQEEKEKEMDKDKDEEQKKPSKTQKPKKPSKPKAEKVNKKKSEFQQDNGEDIQKDMGEDSKMDQDENLDQEKSIKKQKPKTLTKKKNQKVVSDEESNADSNEQQEKPTKKIKKKVVNKPDNEEDKEQSVKPKKVAKKHKLKIESDEEPEENKNEEIQDLDAKGVDSENEPQMGSEGEDQEIQNRSKKDKKKKQRMDSDSEDEIQKSQSEEETPLHKNPLKGLVDSESELDEPAIETSPAKNKLKGLVDSESEAELSNREESAEDQEATTAPDEGKSKKPKVVRESAKKALEGMQAIQSEQQRLHREAHINVPYHQPKPRTLKEFLSRRTINAPLATAMAGGSPMPSRQPRKSVGLRMTREELEAYAKLMEERAKEATEFFKSESEPEEENDSEDEAPMEFKDNPGVLDEVDNPKTPEQPKNHTDELTTEALVEETATEEAMLEEPIMEIEPIASTSAAAALKFKDTFEFQPEIEATSPSKIRLVTEVVELPKLDLSTISITPPSKPATPKITEAIRRLKDEKSLDVSPSIKGDANMVIDLETGDMFSKKPTGVDDLLKRLMKTREAKKHKTTETVNILTTEHGKLEMSKVSIHLHEEEIAKEPKPGAGFMKMQEHLKSLITKKRMEDLQKKKAEEQERMAEDEEEGMDVDEEYEPEDKPGYAEITINEDEEIIEKSEDIAEEDEVTEGIKSDADEDPDDNTVDLDEEENGSENDQESEPESEPETQTGRKKNRIIKAFEDNSDEDDLDLLQTPKPSGVAPITATQLQLSAHKLFDAETRRTASDEENELLDLCSGQFPHTQMLSSTAPSVDTAVISQIPMTQFEGSSQAPDELEGLCSGTFATQLPSQAPTEQTEDQEESHEQPVVANRIVSSDEEDKVDTVEADKPRNKKLTKKRPKKKAKLGFSDDEESDDDVEEFEEESDEEPAEDIPETFVDYDSEENEIVVEMTKKDRKIRAANFVDKEAELSESDWGSADEDEKNMDNYDIELGDEDQFDRDKLRHELGQIHARKMLDQDIREVRKIKEMLFEEEEEGASRQRQFRWKNVENAFSLDDHRPENDDGNEGSGDEENEHLWRKIRYEREQLLLEKGLKAEAASPLSTTIANTSNTGNSIRRLNIISSKKTTVEVKKSSPFLISKTIAGKQQKSAVRGSFLVRDQQTLTKLAGLTKGTSGDVDGTEGSISVKTAKAKNFVFATLTEEEHENRKRKAADLLNSSTETGVNFMKKPKLEPRRDKCLIDQLL